LASMEVRIDYIPDRPEDVGVGAVGIQISVDLPDTEIYLYKATAEALRDALVAELGPPEGYVKAGANE